MEPVGLQARPPDVLGKLSQILGIQQQQQALQGQAAEVKSTQQSQQQREALKNFDFMQHVGEDGTLDLNRLASDPGLRAAAGDQYLQVISAAADAKAKQLQAKSTLLGLRSEQRAALGQMIGPLLGDKDIVEDNEKGRQKVNNAIVEYVQGVGGEDALPVVSAYAEGLKGLPKGKLVDALKMFRLQAMSPVEQVTVQNPQFLNTGGSFQQINPNVAPGAPLSIAATLPPGQQDVVETDQLGNPYRVQRAPTGRITATAAVPGAGGAGGPAVFGPGERATIEAQANKNFENVSANRAAASMAPQQLDQIDKALALSRETATGGSFGQRRAQIEANIGSLIPGFQGMDDAAKVQELEKFTERIATDASKVLGVNARTDAERESIHKQNANIGYTPKAIQAVLQYAKAQTLAMQAKGDAQEAWLKSGGTVMDQHDFETAFRKAYDPRVFQLAVMSPQERAEAQKKFGKDEMSEIRSSAKKLLDLGVHINAN